MADPDARRLRNSDVREHNRGLVLRALDERGPLARAELAHATGLVRGAVTAIVNDLVALGLVRPAVDAGAPRSDGSRRGRPLAALELDGSGRSILAVQFGLDEFLVAAVDLAGRSLIRECVPERTPVADPKGLVALLGDRIQDAVDRLTDGGTPPVALRVVASAPVSEGSETIWIAVNLGWNDVDLGGLLRERLPDLPLGFAIVNDAKMSTRAEWSAIRLRHPEIPIDDVVYLKSDTGIGGGAISRGRPLIARNGLAFEPGHEVVQLDGPLCECGQRGCLEMLAGPDAVLRDAGLRDFAVRFGMPAALDEFVVRVRAGDRAAVESWTAAARWIRMSISRLTVLLQPQAVVVGGYWSSLARDLAPESEMVLDILRSGGLDDDELVVGSSVGRFSAVIGALDAARRELLLHPSRLPSS